MSGYSPSIQNLIAQLSNLPGIGGKSAQRLAFHILAMDEDKAKALGLHTRYTEHGAPYYQEAYEVYECELIYKAPFIKENMTGPGKEFYEKRPQTKIHHMYIGRILSAKRR